MDIASPGLDDQLKSEFEGLVLKARRGELDDWATNAKGSLALIVLLDQFPRNLYRGSLDAFAADGKSWEMATNAIAQDFDEDKEITVYQAFAFYMPLMHQETNISLIAARGCLKALRGGARMRKNATGSARLYRNALLSRKNTEADEEFLKEQKQSV
ncbi:hypothetical protein HYALB_00009047 [Hymenoscyphus albidus]|uniref:DUF924 domain-containing protein n=1 Tax=Hymenoscyphus albidus TaxID=595503 RepID=A0A9N9LL45_9HELO|nr:hypothetical protein HYALB_00009047 [Hymenoscyphus albidus]